MSLNFICHFFQMEIKHYLLKLLFDITYFYCDSFSLHSLIAKLKAIDNCILVL